MAAASAFASASPGRVPPSPERQPDICWRGFVHVDPQAAAAQPNVFSTLASAWSAATSSNRREIEIVIQGDCSVARPDLGIQTLELNISGFSVSIRGAESSGAASSSGGSPATLRASREGHGALLLRVVGDGGSFQMRNLSVTGGVELEGSGSRWSFLDCELNGWGAGCVFAAGEKCLASHLVLARSRVLNAAGASTSACGVRFWAPRGVCSVTGCEIFNCPVGVSGGFFEECAVLVADSHIHDCGTAAAQFTERCRAALTACTIWNAPLGLFLPPESLLGSRVFTSAPDGLEPLCAGPAAAALAARAQAAEQRWRAAKAEKEEAVMLCVQAERNRADAERRADRLQQQAAGLEEQARRQAEELATAHGRLRAAEERAGGALRCDEASLAGLGSAELGALIARLSGAIARVSERQQQVAAAERAAAGAPLECPICCERKPDHALQPCGHCLCEGCAAKFVRQSCPSCRAAVTGLLRLFLT